MQNLLPLSIHQWHISEPPRSYPGTKIFDYMDGAGEVYRAYDFVDLIVQRYACPNQEDIVVECFDMGSARNAFGVFTYMKGRGPAVPIGKEAEYKSGLLCFWKGSYFVYIKIENENAPARNALLELGNLISDAIHQDGERPAIIRYLPESDYLPNTLRYFFRHEILNAHYTVAEGNLLLLNDKAEGVLVRMKRDKSYLLLVGYPDQKHADSAYGNFLTHYMPDAGKSVTVKTKNSKWTGCVKQNTYVILIFDAATKQQAAQFLEKVRRRLP